MSYQNYFWRNRLQPLLFMGVVIAFIFSLFYFSTHKETQPLPLSSNDFKDSLQLAFEDASMFYYRKSDSAVNSIARQMNKKEQEQWMRNFFDSSKSNSRWTGKLYISYADENVSILEIEDFFRVRFKAILTVKDSLLKKQVATIPDSSMVQIKGRSMGVIDFDYSYNPKLGVPNVAFVLDSIKKLPVKY